ncbi:MAG: ABC transporter substrate-binding protein [Kosmotoga sp.]|nr:MAG: ABC transporter substrate-binding protein [Kosmotoga sp.]
MKKVRALFVLAMILLVVGFAFAGKAEDKAIIAMQTEPSKLNPITYQDTETDFVLTAICDPLVELTAQGDYTAEGAVIESYSVSEDGKVYTFNIREGITFHNGEPLTAEDVKFTYEAFMDPSLGSPHHQYYSDIEEVVLVDDYTVEVHLSKRNVTFLTSARLRNHVLPKDYIEDVGWTGYQKKPIGSGPYQFVVHVPGQRIVLRRYEDYWGEKAKIKYVEFRFYPEITTATMALQAKQIDYIAELPAEEYKMLKTVPGLKYGTFTKFEDHRICFNKRPDSVFSDVKVRQAVAYAINREELIALTRGEMAVPAVGRVPYFHAASAPNAPAYEQNLEKARELLKEAGYPDGFKTKIYAPAGYRERVLEVQQIQRQLSEIGIEVEVVTLEWGTYLDVTAEGEAPMFRERWSASAPSPFSFVENWYSESSWNPIFGTYHNEEVDRLIEKIKVTVDEQERWKLYKEVQGIAMKDVACYPLYWPIAGVAYNDELNIPEELFNVFLRPIYNINKWSY